MQMPLAGGQFTGPVAIDVQNPDTIYIGGNQKSSDAGASFMTMTGYVGDLSALATDPQVLLLDEIGGGLTDEEANSLVETIQLLRSRGLAIVWIEHIVHILIRVVDRLICMDAGRIIADGKPEVVIADAAVIDAYIGGRGAA